MGKFDRIEEAIIAQSKALTSLNHSNERTALVLENIHKLLDRYYWLILVLVCGICALVGVRLVMPGG
jgi:hypothetical protein